MRASQFANLSAWRLPNKEFHKGRTQPGISRSSISDAGVSSGAEYLIGARTHKHLMSAGSKANIANSLYQLEGEH
jgi:hypothetical protein